MRAWKTRAGAWLSAIVALAGTSPATAQQPLLLTTQTFVERVTTDINGRPRRILASTARPAPGDQLIVILNWRNDGSAPLRDAALIRPVPRGVELDASDPLMQVSVDGGAHWGRLDQLWLPTALGGVRRAVPADVTHVRWPLPEAGPGQSGRLSYRATLH
jgi:hypothetical protein